MYHEFAHKLDMLDTLIDGTPPLGSRAAVDRWVEVCTEPFQALRAGIDRPPLQPYGATNPAEFFAVATEAFFDVPLELEQHERDLYDVLRDYYNQDPATLARDGLTEISRGSWPSGPRTLPRSGCLGPSNRQAA